MFQCVQVNNLNFQNSTVNANEILLKNSCTMAVDKMQCQPGYVPTKASDDKYSKCCPENSYLTKISDSPLNYQCTTCDYNKVPDKDKCISCPPPLGKVGNKCDVCPVETTLIDGICVPPICPGGTTFNFKTSKCECPTGKVLDIATNKCICPPGTVLDFKTNNCVCPVGTIYKDGKCVQETTTVDKIKQDQEAAAAAANRKKIIIASSVSFSVIILIIIGIIIYRKLRR